MKKVIFWTLGAIVGFFVVIMILGSFAPDTASDIDTSDLGMLSGEVVVYAQLDVLNMDSEEPYVNARRLYADGDVLQRQTNDDIGIFRSLNESELRDYALAMRRFADGRISPFTVLDEPFCSLDDLSSFSEPVYIFTIFIDGQAQEFSTCEYDVDLDDALIRPLVSAE